MLNYSNKDLVRDLVAIAENKDSMDGIKKLFEIHKLEFKPITPTSSLYTQIYDLVHELSLDGGNTIANILRIRSLEDLFNKGVGVPYMEIVYDVADKIDILNSELDKCKNIYEIDKLILMGINKKYFDSLSEKERQEFLNNINDSIDAKDYSAIKNILLGLAPLGLNTVVGAINNRAVQQMLNKSIQYFFNNARSINFAKYAKYLPKIKNHYAILILIACGILFTFNISGPAYRKTVPAVITISQLRFIKALNDSKEEGGF